MVNVAADRVSATVGAPLIRPTPIGGSRLVQDYLNDLPAAARFYAGSPFRLSSYRSKLKEVDSLFGPRERAAAAESLRPTSEFARTRLERFIREGGLAVTTGQQTGFLTGPLYTIYKAISAAALAEHLERELGRVVLPIFWSASEDHDWPEVNHAFVLDPRGRLERFSLPGSDDVRPLPMSRRALEGDLRELIVEIERTLGGSAGSDPVSSAILMAFAEPGRSMAAAFDDAISAVLGCFGMVLADAADPKLKALSRPILRRALEESTAHEDALFERSRAIVSAGYEAQVAVIENATNVFLDGERGRERLYRVGDGWGPRERRSAPAAEAVLAELESNPGRFSPNVLLRPVIESCVFPTLAYVGGPGEIAYLAQAGALFAALGRTPPVAVPRFSGLVVEPSTERLLERLRLSVADLEESRDSLAQRLARRQMPDGVTGTLAVLREDIVRRLDDLARHAEEIDPTLIGALGAERDRLLLGAGRAERKILRALKRSGNLSQRRLDRVLDSIRPGGAPQDRVLNVLPFLARYGEHFLDEVRRGIDEHWTLPSDV